MCSSLNIIWHCLSLELDFPGGSDGKASAYNEGDLGSILGLGRSQPGEGKGYPLQYSGQKAESKEELKSPLMKVKNESEKVGLRLNIKKMKIMASSPITSWQIKGKTTETVTDFLFSQAPNYCRW